MILQENIRPRKNKYLIPYCMQFCVHTPPLQPFSCDIVFFFIRYSIMMLYCIWQCIQYLMLYCKCYIACDFVHNIWCYVEYLVRYSYMDLLCLLPTVVPVLLLPLFLLHSLHCRFSHHAQKVISISPPCFTGLIRRMRTTACQI